MFNFKFFNILNTSDTNIVVMGSPVHVVTLIIVGVLILLVCNYNHFFVKYEKKFYMSIILTAGVLELYYYVAKGVHDYWYQFIPSGLCHLAIYLVFLLMFKYNEKVTKILYFLSFGAFISLLVIDTAESSILNIRYYHYVLVHVAIIIMPAYLMVKHKLTISSDDFVHSIKCIYLFIVLMFIYSSTFSPEDALFLFSPQGTPLELIGDLRFYTLIMFFAYIPFYFIPYLPWKIKNGKSVQCSE